MTTETHVNKLYTRFHFSLLILIVFSVVGLIASLGLLVYNSTTGKALRVDQSKELRLLVECTTAPELRDPPEKNVPDSDCYSRQQSTTSSFIAPNGPFASLITAAASCGSAHPNDIPATRKCVISALK